MKVLKSNKLKLVGGNNSKGFLGGLISLGSSFLAAFSAFLGYSYFFLGYYSFLAAPKISLVTNTGL